jgi:hypothetical protein
MHFGFNGLTIALCDFAKSMIQQAFCSVDPLEAQYQSPSREHVAIVAGRRNHEQLPAIEPLPAYIFTDIRIHVDCIHFMSISIELTSCRMRCLSD